MYNPKDTDRRYHVFVRSRRDGKLTDWELERTLNTLFEAQEEEDKWRRKRWAALNVKIVDTQPESNDS